MAQNVSIHLIDRNTVEVVVDGNKIDGISYYKIEELPGDPPEVTIKIPVMDSLEVHHL